MPELPPLRKKPPEERVILDDGGLTLALHQDHALLPDGATRAMSPAGESAIKAWSPSLSPAREQVWLDMAVADAGLTPRAFEVLLAVADGTASPDDAEWLTEDDDGPPLAMKSGDGVVLSAVGQRVLTAIDDGNAALVAEIVGVGDEGDYLKAKRRTGKWDESRVQRDKFGRFASMGFGGKKKGQEQERDRQELQSKHKEERGELRKKQVEEEQALEEKYAEIVHKRSEEQNRGADDVFEDADIMDSYEKEFESLEREHERQNESLSKRQDEEMDSQFPDVRKQRQEMKQQHKSEQREMAARHQRETEELLKSGAFSFDKMNELANRQQREKQEMAKRQQSQKKDLGGYGDEWRNRGLMVGGAAVGVGVIGALTYRQGVLPKMLGEPKMMKVSPFLNQFPLDTTAKGKPISQAFDFYGDIVTFMSLKRHPASDALESINAVHGDGNLPKIPLIATSRSLYEDEKGCFVSGLWGTAKNISVVTGGEANELTTIHEIGHFLDLKGDRFPESSARYHPDFRGWRKKVLASKAVQNTLQSRKDKPDDEFTEYLARTEEIWARSYAQYIAVRSGNPALKKQLDYLRENEPELQWDDDDFEPIAQEIDKLFRKRGWMQ